MVEVAKRAQNGDESAVPELRKLLQRSNSSKALDLLGGNLARNAERTLVSAATGKNLLAKESLLRKLELLRGELSGPNPTPLERLLVDRVVACWLHLHFLECVGTDKIGQAHTDLGTYFQRSLTQAQRRHLSAIKMLAVVRRLAVPVLTARLDAAVPAAGETRRTGNRQRRRRALPERLAKRLHNGCVSCN